MEICLSQFKGFHKISGTNFVKMSRSFYNYLVYETTLNYCRTGEMDICSSECNYEFFFGLKINRTNECEGKVHHCRSFGDANTIVEKNENRLYVGYGYMDTGEWFGYHRAGQSVEV